MRVLGFLVLYFLKNTLILLKYGKPFAFLLLFFLKILFMTDRQREKQVLCREPDVGLNPSSPESHPRLRVVLNRWATGAAHSLLFKILFFIYF